jgi:hypothetical protein
MKAIFRPLVVASLIAAVINQDSLLRRDRSFRTRVPSGAGRAHGDSVLCPRYVQYFPGHRGRCDCRLDCLTHEISPQRVAVGQPDCFGAQLRTAVWWRARVGGGGVAECHAHRGRSAHHSRWCETLCLLPHHSSSSWDSPPTDNVRTAVLTARSPSEGSRDQSLRCIPPPELASPTRARSESACDRRRDLPHATRYVIRGGCGAAFNHANSWSASACADIESI